MNNFFIFKNLDSHYCKAIFVGSLVLGFFLVPKDVLEGPYKLIAIVFVLIFSLTMACVVRSLKEKVIASQKTGDSMMAVVASVVGISALQVCGLGVPACGASAGVGIVSLIFPGFVFAYLKEYSVFILVVSIFIQLYSLHRMKCFVITKKIINT